MKNNVRWYVLAGIFVAWVIASNLISNGLTYCVDGTWSSSSGRGTCSWHHGVGISPSHLAMDIGFLVALVLWWRYFLFVKDAAETKSSMAPRRSPEPEAQPSKNAKPVAPSAAAPAEERRPQPGPIGIVLFLALAAIGNLVLGLSSVIHGAYLGLIFVIVGIGCALWSWKYWRGDT